MAESTSWHVTITDLPVAALVLDDGVVIDANTAALDELGCDAAWLVGRSFVDTIEPDDRPSLVEAIGRVAADRGGEARLEVSRRLQPAEPGAVAGRGELRCLDVRLRFLTAEADRQLVTAFLHDRTAERRLEAVIRASADSTIVVTEEGVVRWQLRATQPGETIANVDLVGANPIGRIHPEDIPMVMDAFVEAIAGRGERVRRVVRSRIGGEHDLWTRVELEGSSELDDPWLTGVLVRVRNLESGQVIESIGETEGAFLSLTDAAPIGIVVGDMFGRTVYANAAAGRLLGRDPTPELPSVPDAAGAEPTDRDVAASWWADVRAPHAVRLEEAQHAAMYRGESATVLVPFDSSDGSTRWLRVLIAPRFADGRQSVGVITTLEDVTAEVEAREETERLTQMLDATSDFVAVFRSDGTILYVNRALRRLLDKAVATGRAGLLRDLIDDEPRRAWIASAMEVLETTNVWTGELLLNVGDDDRIPVSALGVVKRSEEGGLEWIAMLARDITDLKEAHQRLQEVATHDHLTGLPNRSLFTTRLHDAVAIHVAERRGLAVLFCDLDGFKRINDEFGHAAGDEVLVAVAARLLTATRSDDTAARVGGDEFVLIVLDLSDPDELAALAERLISAVVQPIGFPDGSTARVGISVGVARVGEYDGTVDPDRLLTAADTAMYQAKARGGNTFRITTLET